MKEPVQNISVSYLNSMWAPLFLENSESVLKNPFWNFAKVFFTINSKLLLTSAQYIISLFPFFDKVFLLLVCKQNAVMCTVAVGVLLCFWIKDKF